MMAEATKRRSDEATQGVGAARRTPHASRLRPQGFSLPEVLISIFILAIGLISIAALFPAGIAQQRQSVDDIMGPVVANNALAVLRTKLRPEDFGFGSAYTVEGDFAWSRPAYVTSGPMAGSISIFDDSIANTTDTEVLSSASSPPTIITQTERYYPMVSGASAARASSRPQYVWDCMFRRFQGKVLVAIFVYRVALPGGGGVRYAVPQNYSSPSIPPVPFNLPLADTTAPPPWPEAWDAWGLTSGDPADDTIILGTAAGGTYDPQDQAQVWQHPGQWLLDQNNNVHQVLSRTPQTDADEARVELRRRIPVLPVLDPTGGGGVYLFDPAPATGPAGVENIVTNIWYIPAEVVLDANGDGIGDFPVTLTAVYVSVKEL